MGLWEHAHIKGHVVMISILIFFFADIQKQQFFFKVFTENSVYFFILNRKIDNENNNCSYFKIQTLNNQNEMTQKQTFCSHHLL